MFSVRSMRGKCISFFSLILLNPFTFILPKIMVTVARPNMLADAKSWESSSTLASIRESYLRQLQIILELGVRLKAEAIGTLLASFVVRPSLLGQILES